jgi:hypothetical protein
MKRTFLMLLGGMVLLPLAFNQSPKMSVGTTGIDQSLAIGDTSVVGLVVSNTGNRDLIYQVDFVGPSHEFTKEDYADWTSGQNQDYLTPEVAITRQNNRGFFNIVTESSYEDGVSPQNTEWAFGKTKDLIPADYDNWVGAVNWNPPSMVYNFMSMHIIDRDIYFDVLWNSWTSDDRGGGFSYTRTEIPFWLYAVNNSSSIQPGQSDTIWIVFDTRTTNNILREASIVINSNDPAAGQVLVSASLSITGGDPEAFLADTEFAFGDIFLGASVSLETNVANAGVSPLIISDISNTDPAFSTFLNKTTIEAGTVEILTVQFTPSAVQSYNDTIVLTTNDSANPTIKLPLAGKALENPQVSVLPASFSKEVVYGAGLDYGQNDTAMLVISNPGIADLEWSISTVIPGAAPVTFSKDAFADFGLPENQDRMMDNVWLTRGDDGGLFNIAVESRYDYNDHYSPLGTLWYNGLTMEAVPGDYEEGLKNAVGPMGDNLPLNTVSMYIPETKQYFDVEFLDWGAGNGGSFKYTRTESIGFLNFSRTSNSLAMSGSDTIYVLFNPNSFLETYDANIVVNTNVPGMESVAIPFSYTVSGPPEISVNPGSLSFGDIFLGDTSSLSLEIEGWGAGILQVSSITNDESVFTLDQTSFILAQDTKTEVIVTFIPTSVASIRDTLLITSNAATDPLLKIPVEGGALAPPQMVVTSKGIDHSLDFGDLANDTLIIANTGLADLEWSLQFVNPAEEIISITKANYSNYELAENQDRISENVWLTRANAKGLFNIALEPVYNSATHNSPLGTLWYNGPALEASPGDYNPGLRNVVGSLGDNLVGNTVSMYVPESRSYYDLDFTSWTNNAAGGGFSYDRLKAEKWIRTSDASGITAPGVTDTLLLVIDATSVYGGTYNGSIIVSSNDPGNQRKAVPATLTVDGDPGIMVSDTSLYFENTSVGYSKEVSFTLYNSGSAVLHISNLSAKSGVFAVDQSVLNIPEMDSAEIKVLFQPAAAVLYNDTLTIASDDQSNPQVIVVISGAGVIQPEIGISPEVLQFDLFTDSIHTGNILIENTGGSDLIWSVLYENSLESVLDLLNNDFERIVDAIPRPYIFTYDLLELDTEIDEGGNDMFNGANQLSTDLSPDKVVYSDNVITNAPEHFGMGGRYFTRHLPGLFVMAADVKNIDYFEINGNNGADGDGFVDGAVLEEYVGSKAYQGFVKRIWGAVDPSINHLVIIENTVGATHDFALNTDDDQHRVSGLNEVSRMYHLLYAGAKGYYIDDENASEIMKRFIEAISSENDPPGWITFDTISGSAPVGITDTLRYSVDFEFVPAGNHSGTITIECNDPVTEAVVIPVSLQYGPIMIQNTIDDVLVYDDFGTWTMDYINVFMDQQGDILTHSVFSNEPGVVTSSLIGNDISISETGIGTSIITLRADDGNGNVAYEDFNFSVLESMTVANALADRTEDEGFGTLDISIADVFDTKSNDTVFLSVESGNTSVVTASLAGYALTLTEAGFGTTTISITADNGKGDLITDAFEFTVNGLLVVENPLADLTLEEGFGTHDIYIGNVFTDPDGSAYNVSVQTADAGIATASVDGETLTIAETGLGAVVITLTASDGAADEVSDDFVLTIDAIEAILTRSDSDIKVYPNPSGGWLNLELPGEFLDEVSIHMSDATGRYVYIYEVNNFKGVVSLDLNHLNEGIYMLFVKAGTIDFKEVIILE